MDLRNHTTWAGLRQAGFVLPAIIFVATLIGAAGRRGFTTSVKCHLPRSYP